MLSGSQLQTLNEVLVGVFPDAAHLRMMATYAGLDPSEFPADRSLRETTFYLVQSAQRQGRLEELIDVVQREYPKNVQLSSALDELRSALSESPGPAPVRSKIVEGGRTPEALPGPTTDAVPTHFDRPSLGDDLGRQALVEVLADRLRRLRGEDTEDPKGAPAVGEGLMIHLHAPWGAGKTTLLNLLREELRAPADARLVPWIAVNFDAWQHQRVAPPWWWLLSAIRRDGVTALRRRGLLSAAWFVVRDLRWRAWNARPALIAAFLVACLAALIVVTDGFGLGNKSLSGLRVAATAVSALIALGLTIWGLVGGLGRWLAFGGSPPATRVLQRTQDPLRASQRRFEFLIDALAAPTVILIDDIDRCRADFAVELLEGIQTLFLDRPVTYVIAADREWLCQCYDEAYRPFASCVGDAGRPLGHLFLEKTFQMSLELPPVPDAVLNRYWEGLLRGRPPDARKRKRHEFDELARAQFADLSTLDEVMGALATNGESDASAEARRRAAMQRLNSPDLEAGLQHALEPFAGLVGSNPRSMKRLVNSYGVERALRVRTGATLGSDERIQNVLWTIVKLRWPVLAQYLSQHPELANILAGNAAPTDFDPIPENLQPLFTDFHVREVFAGEGVGIHLDADGVRQFLRWGATPSSVGT